MEREHLEWPFFEERHRELAADLDDHAHGLVTEDVARLHRRRRQVAIVEMEIRAANAAGGDLDDDVRRLLDLRIGNGFDADVRASVPGQGLHRFPSDFSPEPCSDILRCISALRTSGKKRDR